MNNNKDLFLKFVEICLYEDKSSHTARKLKVYGMAHRLPASVIPNTNIDEAAHEFFRYAFYNLNDQPSWLLSIEDEDQVHSADE